MMMAYQKIAGALFLLAIAASLVGGTLVQFALVDPVADSASSMLVAGVTLEVVNALAVVGIVSGLSIVLGRESPAMTVAYAGVRLLEAMVCTIAAFVPLALLGSPGALPIVNAVRGPLVSYAVPILFGVGAVLLYTMLYRSTIVPRYLSIWGLVGAAGVLANAFITDPSLRPILVIPIIVNEIYLGIYLLTRAQPRQRHVAVV